MKKNLLTLILLTALFAGNNCFAQDEKEMKAWQDFMTPGEMHKMMAADNGVWNTEMTMWMKPGTDPIKSTGTSTNSMILGGRYQQGMFKGDFMGMPMEGISTLGYDNAKKMFVSTWIDNMGSGVMYMEGTYDAKTKAIKFNGKQTDPMTNTDMMIKETFTFMDSNTQKMEMFNIVDGKEVKMMEIVFKRKM